MGLFGRRRGLNVVRTPRNPQMEDCLSVRKLILEEHRLQVEAQRHLLSCPACRELSNDRGVLARSLAESSSDPAVNQGWERGWAALQTQLAREARPSRQLMSLPSGWRWAITVVALLFPAVLAGLRLRLDIAAVAGPRFDLENVLLAGLALLGCWYWLLPLYRPRPRNAALLAPVVLGILVPCLLAVWPAIPSPAPTAAPPFVKSAAACFTLGLIAALPVLFVLLRLGRGGVASASLLVLPAVAAALAALVGLELHCSNGSRMHLLVGHAPLVVVLPLALLLAKRKKA